jgi:putative hemolysin
MDIGYNILALIVLVALSALFSGLEISLFSLGKAHVRLLVEKKVRGAKVVQRLKANPERLLATILLGNNIVNIGAASLATVLAIRLFESWGVGAATGVGVSMGVMTFLILVFGEITPKSLAYRWAERYALVFSRPLEVFGKVAFPLVWLIEKLTHNLTRFSGKGGSPTVEHRSLLMSLARMGVEEGKIKERELRVVESAFRLEHVPVEMIMTPRRKMTTVPADAKLENAATALGDSPHTRLPVFRGDMDEIVGILHLREFYEQLLKGNGNAKVADIASKPLFVPRTMVIGDLMRLFQRERVHMAIVIGEYGETVGLATLEDILEEMVGEIEDEADEVRNRVIKLSDHRFLVDASISIEDLRRITGVQLPAGGHHTVNGLLLDAYQNIPKAGTRIKVDSHTFIIRRADVRKVILAEMRLVPKGKD